MKLLIIYTGGTIGMVKDKKSGALAPGDENAIKNFLISAHLISDEDTLLSVQPPIDSVNFNTDRIISLVKQIEENYQNYDGFLVLMGTDTMSYISALVSFMIEGLTKPILFTGAQLPLGVENSDANDNLSGAITYLRKNLNHDEVGIYFNKAFHLAVTTTKVHSTSFDAYLNVKKSSMRQSDTIYNDIVKHFHQPKFEYNINSEVFVLRIDPFMSEDYILNTISQSDLSGVVLQLLGTGNMPDYSDDFFNKLKELINKGLKVVAISQCLEGGLILGKYEASSKIKKVGVLDGHNITVESAIAKLKYLLSKSLNSQIFKQEFEKSLRGEIF